MSEYPPPGTVWVTLQISADSPSQFKTLYGDEFGMYLDGMPIVRTVYGPDPETADQKRARLFKQAAAQIRQGSNAFAPHGPREHDLDAARDGLLLLAEALEVQDD